MKLLEGELAAKVTAPERAMIVSIETRARPVALLVRGYALARAVMVDIFLGTLRRHPS